MKAGYRHHSSGVEWIEEDYGRKQSPHTPACRIIDFLISLPDVYPGPYHTGST